MSVSSCLLQQVPSGLFAQELRASDWESSSFPVLASMDWLSGCNLRCRHCFMRYSGANQAGMPTREVERMLETLRDLGVLFLVITGGEPLARQDFKTLYLKAKRCGFILTLFTNGTLLDDEVLDFLADAPPRRVEITIYGHTESVYEAVTGVPGSFRRFRHGVEGLLRRGMLLRLKSMVMRTNVHELDEMRDWAVGLDCDFRYDAIIHSCWNGDSSPLRERLSPSEVAELLRKDRERQGSDNDIFSLQPELPARQRFFECGAGIMTLHVDGQHLAHPCMSWREDPFDLVAHPTAGAWHAHIDSIRTRPAPGGRCDTCRERSHCLCCPALAFLETGDTAGVSPFLCQLTEENRILRQSALVPPGGS